MLELRFNLIYAEKCVIALGFFDSVHRGHRHLIEKAKERAAENGEKLAVFTFDNNPFGYVGRDEGEVYTYSERIEMLKNMGVDIVVSATMDNEFSATPAVDFLDKLFSTMKISEVFCGSDYRYGKNGFGDVNLLNLVAKHYKVKVNVVDFLLDTADKKISTSTVKQYLSVGNVEAANGLLGEAYHITGVVEKNFGRGKALGFPTANIDIPPEKMCIRHGVYATATVVDGKSYESITNVGDKPTFGVTDVNTETYLIDFDGDLYGKTITVKFFKFIRGIQKYDSKEQLILRLSKDIVESGAIKRF